ncbi:MAG: hypothetical protein ABIO47_09825 [Sphingomicrobium sp.]
MKAGFGLSIAATIAALSATGAAAQSTTAPAAPPAQQPTTPPAADVVGPRELRNFSLGGTPAPRADEPAPLASTPAPTTATATDTPAASRPRTAAPAPREAAPRASTAEASPTQISVTPSPDVKASEVSPPPPASLAPTTFTPPAPIESEREGIGLWPWLLAAVALAGGALLLFRQRSRARLETAGGLGYYTTPDPQPEPTAEPARRAAPAPVASPQPTPLLSPGGGVVSTRLRPWIDFEFVPTRCILDQSQATIEFVITITNTGAANARDLLVETMLFNAGPEQDQEIGGFFAHPVGRGEAIPALAPLKSLEIPSSINLPVERMRLLDAGGRKLFVPLIGFTALYGWSGGQGQTSRSFLLGREGKGEKLAPFHADLGPRVFRRLGAREHRLGVRR